MKIRLLGYSNRKSGTFYTKIKDMQAYGLIANTGRGRYKLTDLGKKITYPPTKEIANSATKEAILNVPLWNKLFDKFRHNLPKEDFWADLSKIAEVDAPRAKDVEKAVYSAYTKDVARLATTGTLSSEQQKSFMLPDPSSKSMELSTTTGSNETIEIPFGMRYSIKYPAKMTPRQAFEQVKKYMEIFVQEYEAEEKATTQNKPPKASSKTDTE
jgi:hypothetical protein